MATLALEQLVTLLLEPSPMQRRIVQGFLEQLGLRSVMTAGTGGQALERMRSEKPDLVISALYLPDMTGTDLVRWMRQDPLLCDTAFMLISSETRFRYLDPIRQAGAIAILPKPFGLDEIAIAVRNTLDYIEGDALELDRLDLEDVTVLIVDDSAMARKYIRNTLAAMGLEHFVEASDGVQALACMQDQFFDLVVTDYNMPHMDGKELVEHIRTDSGQASVPILMVTSEENEGRLAAVQQAGVTAICDKPFDASVLRQLLSRALEEG